MERFAHHNLPIVISSLIGFGVVLFFSLSVAKAAVDTPVLCDIAKDAFCISPRAVSSIDLLDAATIPKIATPSWLQSTQETTHTVQYSVQTRGTITTDIEEFKLSANQTLNDSRGWSRLGIRFEQVETGGSFILFLSEASQMTTFSATGCDTTYSCRVGNSVIINQDRWISATPSWTDGGGSLTDYRHMVINHETGHWLGHGHTYCTTKNQPATLMQQQSINLQGCTPNAWPLASELYAPTLGIRS